MSLPPELLKMMKDALAREEAKQRRTDRVMADIRDQIATWGIPLTPDGLAVFISMTRAIAEQLHDEVQCKAGACILQSPMEAMKIADEFMIRWAKHRDGASSSDARLDKFFAQEIPEIKLA